MDDNLIQFEWHCTGCDNAEILTIDPNELTLQEMIDKIHKDHSNLRKALDVDSSCIATELILNLSGMKL